MRQQFGRDADAGVAHLQLEHIVLLQHRQPDAATEGRVFCRIRDEVDQYLFDAVCIGMQPQRFWRQGNDQLVQAFAHQRLGSFDCPGDNLADQYVALFQADLAAVDA